MGYVHVLDDRVRELISAGEVVERPASVVKELVENSLDAGADRIDIELRNHGLSMISVTDNGKGIEEDDIRTAFLRHATSKISTADDLNAIGSLGFRGEALAAIAAVSRVRLTTKTPDNVAGYRYIIEGGKEISFEECGTPTGTNITVSDIFYNTPARMKFLRKDVAEGNACEQLIWHIALTEPSVSFRLVREGKLVLRTTGQGLYSAIFDLFPREIASRMKEISVSTEDGVNVSGYVASPEDSRASRSLQHISVNGRYIRNRAIQSAAEEAYKGFIMQGRFPSFVISVTVPLDAVDVNVHPAKTEVRFTNERAVTRAVYRAVREAVQTLGTSSPVTSVVSEGETADKESSNSALSGEEKQSQAAPVRPYNADIVPERPAAGRPVRDPARDLFEELMRIDSGEQTKNDARSGSYGRGLDIFPDPAEMRPVQKDTSSAPVSEEPPEAAGSLTGDAQLRVIGEIFRTYIVAQTEDMLVLIDMHAAHERILYELIRDEHATVDSQILLEPVVISMTPDEKQAVLDNSDIMEKLGFSVSELGEREIAVREIPTYLGTNGVSDAVLEIANSLLENRESVTFEAREWLMHSSACRAAIKAGHVAPHQEMVALAEKILCGSIPKFCPHGRPVYFTMTKSEIEKRFGRIV